MDVPYNGNPDLVVPVAGAVELVEGLRASGIKLGLISNQSGIARGMISHAQVAEVNDRVEKIFGKFDVVLYCPHGPDSTCECRKPMPGMIVEAARQLKVKPSECVVIGDKQSDADAARAAGAKSILLSEELKMTAVDNILSAM